jgi:serine/threonine-protein kinase
MSLVGTSVGHIRIVGDIGRGRMGEVYIGLDERLQRRVALKAIRAEYRLDPGARARFLREARMLSQLDDPHICRIHDYIEGRRTLDTR